MPLEAPHVLVIDDDRAFRRLVGALLRRHGMRVSEVESWTGNPIFGVDVVLLDNSLGQSRSGVELMPEVISKTGQAPVILVTATNDVDLAVNAMRAGSFDFLAKPVDEARLVSIVRHALQHNQLIRRVTALEAESSTGCFGMIGVSPAMREVFQAVESVASSDAPVLIHGESGTGKELVARALHERSQRANEAMVTLNVAAIPRDLIESTLFGHEKGAFTGADARHIGAGEQASGGTLFLDELGEMPAETQPKLLRFLQDGRYRRVGGVAELESDVRVISATNLDPEQGVRDGRLRADLFYRLSVVPIRLSPLRERPEDIEPLCHHFLDEFQAKYGRTFRSISPRALDKLRRARWPGNVRQLRHTLERLVIMNDVEELTSDLVPTELDTVEEQPSRQVPVMHRPSAANEDRGIVPMSELERKAILDAVEKSGGSPTRAARALGISEATIYRKLRKYRGERLDADPTAATDPGVS